MPVRRGRGAPAEVDGTRASTRGRILAAAIHAFARGGFRGASTREIAEAAGVTDPLLFYYFTSKADLYREAVHSQLVTLGDGLGDALREADDPREQLGRFVEVYLRYFLDLEPGLTVTLRELNGVPQPTADAIAQTHHVAVTERLEGILRGGVARGTFRPLPVTPCAFAIVGMLQGFIRVEGRTPGRFSRVEIAEQVLGFYLPGLLAAASIEPT